MSRFLDMLRIQRWTTIAITTTAKSTSRCTC